MRRILDQAQRYSITFQSNAPPPALCGLFAAPRRPICPVPAARTHSPTLAPLQYQWLAKALAIIAIMRAWLATCRAVPTAFLASVQSGGGVGSPVGPPVLSRTLLAQLALPVQNEPPAFTHAKSPVSIICASWYIITPIPHANLLPTQPFSLFCIYAKFFSHLRRL
jgi:hypothetical protein